MGPARRQPRQTDAAPVRDLARKVVVRQSPAARGSVPSAGAERAEDGASARRAAVPVPAPDLRRGTERGGRDHTLAVGHRAPAGLSKNRSDRTDSLLRRGRHVPQRLRRGWWRALNLACLVNRAGYLHLSTAREKSDVPQAFTFGITMWAEPKPSGRAQHGFRPEKTSNPGRRGICSRDDAPIRALLAIDVSTQDIQSSREITFLDSLRDLHVLSKGFRHVIRMPT